MVLAHKGSSSVSQQCDVLCPTSKLLRFFFFSVCSYCLLIQSNYLCRDAEQVGEYCWKSMWGAVLYASLSSSLVMSGLNLVC